jgi:hypothetical protein
MEWLPETLKELRELGIPWWAGVLFGYGVALIWKGHSWLKVILTYLNERRRIEADIKLKSEKAAADLNVKIERSRRSEEKVKTQVRRLKDAEQPEERSE